MKSTRRRTDAKVGLLLLSAIVFPIAAAQTGKTPLRMPRGFDLAAAMKSLYGNYDPATQVSDSIMKMEPRDDSPSAPVKNMHVRPFFAATASEDAQEKVFLVTNAVPAEENFDCHVRSPMIGMAVFLKTAQGWDTVSVNKTIVYFGAWGGSPNARAVQIGPQRTGIVLQTGAGNQGQYFTITAILVPWHKDVVEAFLGETGHSNDGDCGPELGHPCFDHQKEISFVPGHNPDYFDLLLTLSGTDFAEDTDEEIRKVQGTERFAFSEGKYGEPLGSGSPL